jgi:hypothetical protein
MVRRSLFLLLALTGIVPAGAETGFDEKYERDYNIFNPITRYQPDNPLNPINAYSPDNPFNSINRYDPNNPHESDQPIQSEQSVQPHQSIQPGESPESHQQIQPQRAICAAGWGPGEQKIVSWQAWSG